MLAASQRSSESPALHFKQMDREVLAGNPFFATLVLDIERRLTINSIKSHETVEREEEARLEEFKFKYLKQELLYKLLRDLLAEKEFERLERPHQFKDTFEVASDLLAALNVANIESLETMSEPLIDVTVHCKVLLGTSKDGIDSALNQSMDNAIRNKASEVCRLWSSSPSSQRFSDLSLGNQVESLQRKVARFEEDCSSAGLHLTHTHIALVNSVEDLLEVYSRIQGCIEIMTFDPEASRSFEEYFAAIILNMKLKLRSLLYSLPGLPVSVATSIQKDLFAEAARLRALDSELDGKLDDFKNVGREFRLLVDNFQELLTERDTLSSDLVNRFG